MDMLGMSLVSLDDGYTVIVMITGPLGDAVVVEFCHPDDVGILGELVRSVVEEPADEMVATVDDETPVGASMLLGTSLDEGLSEEGGGRGGGGAY